MTPTIHTRASFAAALIFGIAIGALYGPWRSAADLAALDRDLAVIRVRLEYCEESLAGSRHDTLTPTGWLVVRR